jgi:hypothetical protein
MKNPAIIPIITAAVVIFGLGAYMLSQNSPKSDSMMPKEVVPNEPTDAMMMQQDDDSMENDQMEVDEAAAPNK